MERVQRKQQVNMRKLYPVYTSVLLLTLTLMLCAGNHDRHLQAVNNNGGSQDSKKQPPGEWSEWFIQ